MSCENKKQEWQKYCEREFAAVAPLLKRLGLELDQHQPHISGEKYLMQSVTTPSGKKLIFLGRDKKRGRRVVIKLTSDPRGKQEIGHERKCRQALQKINFAYQTFFSPKEIAFVKHGKIIIFVQEFIESEKSFLERPIEEQFFLALKAFKAQESSHATTYQHKRFVKKTFGEKNAEDYVNAFNTFKVGVKKILPEKPQLHALFEKAGEILQKNKETIEQYCGFLTHIDFVPHNFRVIGEKIYLLDHSSIRFGDKYEGWARFINFMVLYQPKVEQILVEYVRNNRTKEEALSLQLMRIYRLGEIIYYYSKTLSKASGNLFTLNSMRVDFWSRLLQAILDNKILDNDIIEDYKKTRDSLRSEEEKQRQKTLY